MTEPPLDVRGSAVFDIEKTDKDLWYYLDYAHIIQPFRA